MTQSERLVIRTAVYRNPDSFEEGTQWYKDVSEIIETIEQKAYYAGIKKILSELKIKFGKESGDPVTDELTRLMSLKFKAISSEEDFLNFVSSREDDSYDEYNINIEPGCILRFEKTKLNDIIRVLKPNGIVTVQLLTK